MPVPTSIDDLDTTAGNNSPSGSESPNTADNYLRAHAAFIAELRDDLTAFETTLVDSGGSALVGFLQGGTGAVERLLQAKVREVAVSVKDFGATGDGTTDDTTAIQAAIDYVESLRGGDVKFPPGDYMITAQLNVNSHNVRLLGSGQGGYNTGTASIRTTSASRIFWGAAASVTSALVEFKTPDAGVIQSGGGIERMMLDCMNLAGVGLRLRTWAHGRFADLVVYGSTADGIRLTTTTGTLGAEPYDCLKNVFINVYTIFGNLPTNNSNGIRLGRATSSPGTGNACYNRFYGCAFLKGSAGGGYGILLENCDNNMFFSVSASEVRLGCSDDGDGVGAARANAFFGLEADVTARASQTGLNSSNTNYICGLNTSNSKGNVTVETGAGGSSDATVFVDWSDGRKKWPAKAVASGATITSQDMIYRQYGAWTPSVQGGTTAGTVTVASQLGTYTLSSDRCDFEGFLNYNSLTGTGELRLTGLPFTAKAGLDVTVNVRASNLTFTGQLAASVVAGQSYIVFPQVATGAAMSNVQVDAAAIIHVSGSYQIS